jgi:flagellin-specific chaperone FliS
MSAAEIYLQEALYLTMSQDNVLGTARAYQLLGQFNIHARELARRAADAYDQLWQARNAIARGYYRGVDENLHAVIDENLRIRRYGAAADAWEALGALHDKEYDPYEAQLARLEAARLYAATGQMTHVHRLLDGLDRSLIDDAGVAEIEGEMSALFEQHEKDVIRASQARDYQMMYHHYQRLGEVEQAWKFRIKSSETLAGSSDRAIFERQADVLAVLYNSNFAMDRARKYLDQAGSIYQNKGVREMLDATRDMESLIY